MSLVTTSVLVVNFNAREALHALLATLGVEEETATEVIVIDNASFDGSAEMVAEKFPRVRVMRMETNRGFAAAANRGLREAAGNVVVVCHSDIVATVHVLAELADRVREGRTRRVAAMAARVFDLNKNELPSAARFPGAMRGMAGAWHPTWARRPFIPYLDHAADHEFALSLCIAFDAELLHTLGGFDEGFFLYYHDADLCRRLHDREYRILFAKGLRVVHHRPSSAGLPAHRERLMRADQMRFFRKHAPRWQQAAVAGAMKVGGWFRKE